MERLGRVLCGHGAAGPGALAAPRLDRLADAIVALEYYMEMLQAGRREPWRMLENAELMGSRRSSRRPARSSRCGRARAEHARPRPSRRLPPARHSRDAVRRPPRPRAVAAHACAASTTRRLEPEFLQLFVEEARENVASLGSAVPGSGSRTRSTRTALREVRRVFHTLKGSGRMVGARRVVEFAWASRTCSTA